MRLIVLDSGRALTLCSGRPRPVWGGLSHL